VVMTIDASQSVEITGWEAEVKFAKDLVQALTAEGNPNGQRVNLHYFNKGTMPIGDWAGGVQNSAGQFSTDQQAMFDALDKLVDRSVWNGIRQRGTDHPQAYMTAKAALGSPSYESKVLVMITDGLTHQGTGCGDLKKDIDKVEAKIGKCEKNNGHVCAQEIDGENCNFKKCMCHVYNAALFKQAGYKLIIVGIPNLNHAEESFTKIMKESASPGEYYEAADFASLPTLVPSLTNNLCD